MSGFSLKTDNTRSGLISLDARTLLFMIALSNICIFMTPNVKSEVVLMASLSLIGLLCGVKGFVLKIDVVYLTLLATDLLIMMQWGDTSIMFVALGCRYIRKVMPTAILGGVLILTIRVGELMASLTKLKLPKSIVVPITVLLRYFPSMKEDRVAIKKAMAMRGLSGNFLRHPVLSIECLYVPLLISASRRADELSCAAVTRGIENPKVRTTLNEVGFHLIDVVIVLFTAGVSAWCIYGG